MGDSVAQSHRAVCRPMARIRGGIWRQRRVENSGSLWVSCFATCSGSGTDKDCDEFPFAAAKEGGKQKFSDGRVSIKAVLSAHNQEGGRHLWNRLLSPQACGIKDYRQDYAHSGFVVVPTNTYPITVGRCADGRLITGSGG